jgi:hypothetical protein
MTASQSAQCMRYDASLQAIADFVLAAVVR